MNQQIEERVLELMDDIKYHIRAAKEAQDKLNGIPVQAGRNQFRIGLVELPQPEEKPSVLEPTNDQVK